MSILYWLPNVRDHLLSAGSFIMVKHLRERVNNHLAFLRKDIFEIAKLAAATGQTVTAHQRSSLMSI
jgi:hypothetical protein